MNRCDIDNSWDECRDGDLTGQQREEFDRHMLDDPDLAALWGAESRWLGAIKLPESGTDEGDQAADVSFRNRVIAAWDADRHRRAAVYLFWRRAMLAAGCAAAAVIAVMFTLTGPPERRTDQMLATSSVHPVTVLVSDMSDQAWAQPEQLYNAVHGTKQLFTIERAIRMLQTPAAQNERRRQ